MVIKSLYLKYEACNFITHQMTDWCFHIWKWLLYINISWRFGLYPYRLKWLQSCNEFFLGLTIARSRINIRLNCFQWLISYYIYHYYRSDQYFECLKVSQTHGMSPLVGFRIQRCLEICNSGNLIPYESRVNLIH